MVRLNMILLMAVVICALGVVTAQHRARKLYQGLESEQDRARQLEIEYGQIQLELSTWATHPRIESIARERLHMVVPDAAGRVVPPKPQPAKAPAAAKPATPAKPAADKKGGH
jgi:cell division protein FtsL